MQCQPLNLLLNDFKWNENAESAFTILKVTLASLPMLNYPDYTLPFKVTTDASDDGIGAVLVNSITKTKDRSSSLLVHSRPLKKSGAYER